MRADEFMHKYRADVRSSTERCHVPDYFPFTASAAYSQLSSRYKETQYIEIKLTEEAFNYMLAEEERLKRADAAFARLYAEERIRRRDPRVAKAYDKYRTLLSLVEYDFEN